MAIVYHLRSWRNMIQVNKQCHDMDECTKGSAFDINFSMVHPSSHAVCWFTYHNLCICSVLIPYVYIFVCICIYIYIYTHDVNRYMYTAYTYYHVLHINKISHNFTICTLQRSAQVFVSPPWWMPAPHANGEQPWPSSKAWRSGAQRCATSKRSPWEVA